MKITEDKDGNPYIRMSKAHAKEYDFKFHYSIEIKDGIFVQPFHGVFVFVEDIPKNVFCKLNIQGKI